MFFTFFSAVLHPEAEKAILFFATLFFAHLIMDYYFINRVLIIIVQFQTCVEFFVCFIH